MSITKSKKGFADYPGIPRTGLHEPARTPCIPSLNIRYAKYLVLFLAPLVLVLGISHQGWVAIAEKIWFRLLSLEALHLCFHLRSFFLRILCSAAPATAPQDKVDKNLLWS